MVLTSPNEEALQGLAKVLDNNGISYAPVVENSGPHAGQLMALGLHPRPKSEVRRFLSALPLLKEMKPTR